MDADFASRPEAIEARDLVESTCSSLAGYRVTTAEQYQDGAGVLKRIKGAQQRIEALRTAITAPLNAALKAANDLFRAPAQRLLDAERAIKGELARYSEEQERIRREEQRRADEAARKQREALEQRAAKAEASGKVEKASTLALQAAAVVAPVIQREAPKVAGIAMREVAEYEVTDASLLPREYLVPDDKKIGAVVRALKLEAKIPGVTVRMIRKVAAGAA